MSRFVKDDEEGTSESQNIHQFLENEIKSIKTKLKEEKDKDDKSTRLINIYTKFINILDDKNFSNIISRINELNEVITQYINNIEISNNQDDRTFRILNMLKRLKKNHLEKVLSELSLHDEIVIENVRDSFSSSVDKNIEENIVYELTLSITSLNTQSEKYFEYFRNISIKFLNEDKNVYIGITTIKSQNEPLFSLLSRGMGKNHHMDGKNNQLPEQIYYTGNFLRKKELIDLEYDLINYFKNMEQYNNSFLNVKKGKQGNLNDKGILYLRIYKRI